MVVFPLIDKATRVHLLGILGALMIGIAWLAPLSCSSTRGVDGLVIDAQTGAPIAGAAIAAKGIGQDLSVKTDADGRYHLEGLTAETTVDISAERYHGAQFTVGSGGEVKTTLRPIVVQGVVRDAYTGKPIPGAQVAQDGLTVAADSSGVYRVERVDEGGTIIWRAEGYATVEQPLDGSAQLDIVLRPTTLSGRVVDAESGQPVAGATVSVGERHATSDAEGHYSLTDVPTKATATITAAGYKNATIDVSERAALDVEMEPFVVKAAYLTYYGVAHTGLRENVLSLIETTELNAVVIDIKGDFGRLAYLSEVPLAEAIGANAEPTIPDVEALLATLKSKGIYSIARIVVFKDDVLGRNGANAGLDVAVHNATTGGPWIDGENLVWVDPFRTETWDYNVALAVEAAEKGFDEIQFDYIRFPTDPSPGSSVGAAVYSRPSNEANRTAAIEGFLAKAREALQPLGASISVDVFGYTCWRDDDMGIGQNIENMAKYVDFMSPMVYPSTFSHGLPMEPNYANAPAHPYEIVYYSIKRAVERLQGMPVKVRPWLQYFDDYPWESGMRYDAAEIIAQKKANQEAGGIGYMLWDPTNRFSRGGLDPE